MHAPHTSLSTRIATARLAAAQAALEDEAASGGDAKTAAKAKESKKSKPKKAKAKDSKKSKAKSKSKKKK